MTNSELRSAYLASTAHPNRCAICWIPAWALKGNRWPTSFELAHIIPRSRGHAAGQVVGNVLILCSSCHQSQHFGLYGWPKITEGMLMLAKDEIGELDQDELARIAGATPQWVRWKIDTCTLKEFKGSRERWGASDGNNSR